LDKLSEVRSACLECRECDLSRTRTQVVFGTGDPEAEVLFIGEGPGQQEDLQGEPFVGRAGKLLDDMLEMIDLSRDRIYIANIVKCRPPGNRDPLGEEQRACMHWLDTQRDLIRPKLIVCLGRIAAGVIIDGDFKITRDHGKWFDLKDARAMALYHPAALLRDPRKRPETFADLRTLRAEICRLCVHTYDR
jgi:DNA polymerase